MDILAHGLWAWAGAEVLRRRGYMMPKTVAAGVALAVAPDLVQMVPVLVGVLAGAVSGSQLLAYVTANPGQEPILERWVSASAHHLHCSMHSIIALGLISLVAWRGAREWLWPLLGWWLHIATDVPTHSASYYAVPIFYPITNRGFDGFAWTVPWFIAVNYLTFAIVCAWLYRTRIRRSR